MGLKPWDSDDQEEALAISRSFKRDDDDDDEEEEEEGEKVIRAVQVDMLTSA